MYEDLTTERLEAEITHLAAQLAAGTCRFLLMVAELDRREAWKAWGARSCADWLSRQCGLALATARDQVRVAHALPALPATTAAFEQGELSYSKVRALARVATPDNEEELVDLARNATASQLDRVVSASVAAAAPAADISAKRRLVVTEEDGFGVLRGRLTPEQHAIVVRALEAVDNVSAETPGERNADALVAICEAFLAGDAPERVRPAPERQQVVVHVDAAVVAGEKAADVEGTGLVLHPDVARRLGCDATVLAMFERDGKTIGAGRTTRTIPKRLRRALRRRSGGSCEWPGCSERRHVEAHHLVHWFDGGPTELDNLANLCWWHHHATHDVGFRVELVEGVLEVHRPDDGRAVEPAPVTHADGPPGDVVGPDAIPARAAGERVDLRCAVDAVVSRIDRRDAA